MDYAGWLKGAIACLAANAEKNSQTDSPKRQAEILLEFVTGHSRAFILGFTETQLTAEQQQQLDQLLSRRCQGEPIAYLLGEREFWSLPLKVSSVTLIPRADTECLVALALQKIPVQGGDILDLGSGTGAIALALASERSDCRVTGVDRIATATELAKDNARRLAISNADFITGDWFSPLTGRKFALIVSNPPYIDAQDCHLQQGDLRFEPRSALVSAEEGFADLRTIIHRAPGYLMAGGWLLLEHGWQQAERVRAILNQTGFQHIRTAQDYANNDRVTFACWNG